LARTDCPALCAGQKNGGTGGPFLQNARELAGQAAWRIDTILFLGNGQRRMVAPLARDDLIGPIFRARPDDQRHEDAACPHRRQNVGEVRLLAHAAHVGGRNREVRDVDMFEFHGPVSLLFPNHRSPG
jgi:hypothetical protein